MGIYKNGELGTEQIGLLMAGCPIDDPHLSVEECVK